MYTAYSLNELIIRGVNGGNFTSDQKIDPAYTFSQLPRWRAMAVTLFYNGGKVPNSNTIIKGFGYLNTSVYQNKIYQIDNSIQDPNVDYLLFESCGVNDLSNNVGGLQYCGSNNKTQTYLIAKTRIELEQFRDLGFFGRKPIVLIDGERRLVYGMPFLPSFLEIAVYSDPYFHITNFNYETDMFPVCEQVAGLMKAIAVAELAPEFRAIKDVTAEGGNLEQNIIKQTT